MRSHNSTSRYAVTPAGFLFCQDCGCMVMEGYRTEHDNWHRQASVTASLRVIPPGSDQPVTVKV